MIIDCISDLHGEFPHLEGGDLLIVAGDLTSNDTERAYLNFYSWLHKQNYRKYIVIAGNHDNAIQKDATIIKSLDKTTYLEDSGTEFCYHIEGLPEEDEAFLPSGKRNLKIWGSPWTKTFDGMNPHCKAFTVDSDEELDEKWALIPNDIDVLITHSPPYDILDECYDARNRQYTHVGSKSLLKRVCEIKPRLHVFGHIHPGYGQVVAEWDHPPTQFVNAAHMNEYYEGVNKPIRVIL